MREKNQEDGLSVYEIGYLIAPSVPEEKIPAEAEILRGFITKAGASIIAEEAPRNQRLAYSMRKKNVSGSYEKYNDAYFGWIKFDLESSKIDAVKKSIEDHSSVLRSLLISTTRENTYLGKRASAVAADFGLKRPSAESVAEASVEPIAVAKKEEKKDMTPASIEEMDKSIEEMVREA